MKYCRIHKSIAGGTVAAPPSKSYAHRLILASFLASLEKDSCVQTISNIALSEDIKATLNCVKALGCRFDIEANSVSMQQNKLNMTDPIVLECNESGSTMRFMLPVALALAGNAVVKGTPKLLSRGLGVYTNIFDDQGIVYSSDNNSLSAKGKLKSGVFKIDGSISSQFVTGLLFALPLLENDSRIEIMGELQSRPYVDITIDVLERYGISVRFEDNAILVPGGQHYHAVDSVCPADWSNAAFLDFFNYIGGKVNVTGLDSDSLQGDRIYKECFRMLDNGFCTIDVKNCIDLGPVLFTMASIKHGATFVNTRRLRIKESDRVADICTELAKTGAEFRIEENSVTIKPGTLTDQTPEIEFDSHNDHRLAMSLAVLASVFGATVKDCGAVAKSFPDFFEKIQKLDIFAELYEK
ncbi:MAG: 3-phosphoshikimate 1-carboxyvinyltransferase [Bacteroidaceae bacterium]|nr:3-phosphoshikimate 1-carboxyvinyltransferase [Bacteroidaceae bacterium]